MNLCQVLDEFSSISPMPSYIADLISNERSYRQLPDIFPKMTKTYDAYEKDIAVVQVTVFMQLLPGIHLKVTKILQLNDRLSIGSTNN